MRTHEIDTAMDYIKKVYPRAVVVRKGVTEHRWPEERQKAMRDQLRSIDVEFAQFAAVVNDIAMRSKNSWCPPEAEILKRLRGLSDPRVTDSLTRELTAREQIVRQYLRENPEVLAQYAQDWRESDNHGRFDHWPDWWFVADKKGQPNQYVWTVRFLVRVTPLIDPQQIADAAASPEDRRMFSEWTRHFREHRDDLDETQLRGLDFIGGKRGAA